MNAVGDLEYFAFPNNVIIRCFGGNIFASVCGEVDDDHDHVQDDNVKKNMAMIGGTNSLLFTTYSLDRLIYAPQSCSVKGAADTFE